MARPLAANIALIEEFDPIIHVEQLKITCNSSFKRSDALS